MDETSQDPDKKIHPNKVGRGRPPVDKQWKPGQSGNPSGKRKGSLSLKKEVQVLLTEVFSIREKGMEKQVSALALVLMRTRQDAFKGNIRAVKILIELARLCSDPDTAELTELPEEDATILSRALASVASPEECGVTSPDHEGEGDD